MAASQQGADLDELLRIGREVNDVTRTMGVALTTCTPPAKGRALFELGADGLEMGVGVHGEPGRERKGMAPADAIVRAARGRRHRPALLVRGPGRPHARRSRRHADQRARHPVPPRPPVARRAGHERGPQLRQRVLHVARHGRRLPDARPARRRDRGPARRTCRGARPRLPTGRTRLRTTDPPTHPTPEVRTARLITLDRANAIVAACVQEATSVGQPTDIAVVDDGGNPVAFSAMDGTELIGEDISQRKALTAVSFQMDAQDLAPLVQPGQPLYGIEATTGGRLVVFGGGVLLRTADGAVAGGVGVSPGTVDEDHRVAAAGRAAFSG